MIINGLRSKDLFHFALPEKASGQYPVYMEDDRLAGVIGSDSGKWILTLEKGYRFASALDTTRNQGLLNENSSLVILEEDTGKHLFLIAESSSEEGAIYTKYYIRDYGEYRIGRALGMDIQVSSNLISDYHATIVYDGTKAWIQDIGTANGTYVNGLRIHEKKELRDGDLIYIVGLKMVYANQVLAINKPNHPMSLSNRLRRFQLQSPTQVKQTNYTESKISKTFFRSPRFINKTPYFELKIDPPPSPVEIQSMPLAFVLGPSLTMGLASVMTAMFTIINAKGDMMRVMPTLIMSFSMLTMTVLWPILTKSYEKRRRIRAEKERRTTYMDYLEESHKRILAAIENQEQLLREKYPSTDQVIERVFMLDRALWDRSPWHGDYLSIRLGMGNTDLVGKISCPEKSFKVRTDDLEDKMYELAQVDYKLSYVPITVKLDEVITGIIGDRMAIRDMVKIIISQLVSSHSYNDCKLVVEYSKEEEDYWKFLYDLPHCWDDAFENRAILSSSGDLGIALAPLSKVFERRKEEFEQSNRKEFGIRYVLILLDRSMVQVNAIVRSILEYKEYLGISVIAAFDELRYLPPNCTQIIELNQSEGKLYHRYSEQENYTKFIPDICKSDVRAMARAMANIVSDNVQKQAELPTMISFMEMMKIGRVEQLNCISRWKEHNSSQDINSELGVNEQGEPFILNLHEKSHGPHGLIAGMTGSGKSELIMTLILSLAVNYHPHDVAFILIDFKGGGMAKTFEKLPHTVGIITNLDGNEIKRSLASINSELRKRQMEFVQAANVAGESNIDIYKYQQLYRSGVVSKPLPHLFIISDEFAELKSQHPDFMTELISAARIGRSLGVHLILATQKPSGVVDDQIWSNSKFRICLKVQDRSDSQDVIKRPDAAELNITGRFYLQVGYNELFETGQSAWSGAPYYPSDTVQKKHDDNLIVINRLGHQILSVSPEKNMALEKDAGKQIDSVVRYLCELAKGEEITLPKMWKEALPEAIELGEIGPYNYENRVAACIGLVDDPDNQNQYPLVLDISKGGNTLIYGISGSGRTTLLCTLIYQLISSYQPDNLNIHLIDCGSGSLNAFREAPHIGRSLSMYDDSEIDSLFKSLKKEAVRRKEQFAKIGGEYSSYYASGKRDIPCIIVFINNYAAFYEGYNEKEDDIVTLTREGSKYGIYFIVAASVGGSVRNRVAQNFKQLYVLQMNDRIDYSAILGSTGGVYPTINPGRGIYKVGSQAYEFQCAYVHDTNDYNRFAFFSKTSEDLLSKNGGIKAGSINTMAHKLDYKTFVHDLVLSGGEKKIPIGLEMETDEKLYLNFNSNTLIPIMSESRQYVGFSHQFLRLLDENQVETFVFDTEGLLELSDTKNINYIEDGAKVNEELSKLITAIVQRFRAKKEGKIKSEEDLKPLVIYFNNYATLDALLSDELRGALYDLLEKAVSLNTMIIFGGRPSSVSPFAAHKWYRVRFGRSDGLWIGPGYDRQNIFLTARPFMQKDIRDNNCYLLNNGTISLALRLVDDAETIRRDSLE